MSELREEKCLTKRVWGQVHPAQCVLGSTGGVDLSAGIVTFKKTSRQKTAKARKKTRSWRRGTAEWMKKTPRPTTPQRRRRPSKTRISRAMARLRNMEREKASMRQYRGRFKPKPALEKKLYKPDVKPE